MGEVRVKARLTNPVDETLAQQGKLPPQEIRSIMVDALVDTGAVRSVIPPEVFQKLGVLSSRQRVVEYADGRKETASLTDGIRFEIMERDTIDDAYVLGDEVLIGQTILEKLDLFVDCARNRIVPNPAHPDQAVNKLK